MFLAAGSVVSFGVFLAIFFSSLDSCSCFFLSSDFTAFSLIFACLLLCNFLGHVFICLKQFHVQLFLLNFQPANFCLGCFSLFLEVLKKLGLCFEFHLSPGEKLVHFHMLLLAPLQVFASLFEFL